MELNQVKTKKQKRNALLVWVSTVLASALIIYFGNFYASAGLKLFTSQMPVLKATVNTIVKEESDSYSMGAEIINTTVTFTCTINEGAQKGKEVTATQSVDGLYGDDGIKKVEPGDDILILYGDSMDGSASWYFSEYQRLGKIAWLGLLFVVLVLIFGRFKGVNTLLSLGFTCAYVFLVFVPAVLNGYNIYLHAILTCIYTIFMTLLLINGFSTKTFTTIIGCVLGVLAAGIITLVMDKVLVLSGFSDEHSIHLLMLNSRNPINLRAITFGSIIIGAMGAVMDVAMDLSSSLYEIQVNAPDISFGSMVKSGFAIGRDIMGTMANTLVLAYIGSSLCSTLLLFTYTNSLTDMLNKEKIIVELLQALAGSTAILLTMPATVFVCAFFYISRNKKKPHKAEVEEVSVLESEE